MTTPPPNTLLQLEQVGKRFDGRPALRGVDFALAAGDGWCLCGPNGAGKTTLLRLLAGLLAPDEGRVVRAPELARGAGAIGLVTHLPHLYQDLSAAENLLYFARLQRLAEPSARVAALLAQFGLARTGELAVRRFSRGMQQRLALARALLSAPALLLLDEPFSGLDQEGIADLTACLVALRREGLTLVLSTHQLEIAEPLAEQVLCLARGAVAWRGARGAEPLAELYRRVYARPPAAAEAP